LGDCLVPASCSCLVLGAALFLSHSMIPTAVLPRPPFRAGPSHQPCPFPASVSIQFLPLPFFLVCVFSHPLPTSGQTTMPFPRISAPSFVFSDPLISFIVSLRILSFFPLVLRHIRLPPKVYTRSRFTANLARTPSLAHQFTMRTFRTPSEPTYPESPSSPTPLPLETV